MVPRRETEFPWTAKRAARFIDQLGHNKVSLGRDSEPTTEALAREIARARQEGSQTVLARPPVEESQAAVEHRIESRPTQGYCARRSNLLHT